MTFKCSTEENHEKLLELSSITIIKSRKKRWAGHVAHTERRKIQGFGGKTGGK